MKTPEPRAAGAPRDPGPEGCAYPRTVSRWTCPQCEREFGRANAAHVCVPGCSVDATFLGRPAVQREIYAELIDHVRRQGPVHEDAVRVGVFLKADRKLAEVRPKSRWLSLEFELPRALAHPRIVRRIAVTQERFVHVVRLSSVEDVDDEVRNWLSEAYHAAVGRHGT